MPEENIVGNNIRIIRKLYKMTQADLGKAIGTTKSHICEYEKGKRPITRKQMEKITKVLSVSENVLKAEKIKKIEFAKTIGVKEAQKFYDLHEKITPIFTIDDDKQDCYHKRALDKQLYFFDGLQNLKEEDANEVLRLYKKSWDEYKTIESTINAMTFMLEVSEFIDYKTIEEKTKKNYTTKDSIRIEMFAKDHLVDKCYKTNFSWEKRKKFASKHICEIEKYIDALKQYPFSDEANEIGYFFDAIRYAYGLIQDQMSEEKGKEITGIQIQSLCAEKNKYATNYEKLIKILYK